MAHEQYTIVEDSHFRRFLKEQGYGFIAEGVVRHHGQVRAGVDVRPMNKGCDMAPGDLEELWARAVQHEHRLRSG
jgi:hypothetical protein